MSSDSVVGVYGVWEKSFVAASEYELPVLQCEFAVTLVGPSGRTIRRRGFWDEGKIWRIRFSPEEVGEWRYRTESADAGLNGWEGTFLCEPYTGENPLYRRGPVRVAESGTHFAHADGTPFFFLADTVWAGPLLATPTEWEYFLNDRAEKRFTAIHFMGTQNIACVGDAQGRQAFAVREPGKLRVDSYFFRRLDAYVDAINAAGLVACPTFLWASAWHGSGKWLNPGVVLPDDLKIAFGKYFVARYGAHQVIWLHGGDADYRTPGETERWRNIGRAIFDETPRRPVVVHPTSFQLLKDEFGGEEWVDFLGYQGCHSSGERFVKWNTRSEPATDWQREPIKPIVNLEPIYEDHLDFHTLTHSTPHAVRNAIWWSLLVSPTAGVTYGAHGVWSWNSQPAIALHHEFELVGKPWREAMHLPGSVQMRRMRDLMDGVPWTELRPCPERVVVQPGKSAAGHWVAASGTEDGKTLIVYFPDAVTAGLNLSDLGPIQDAFWHDPTTAAPPIPATTREAAATEYTPPESNAKGAGDWLLILRF